MHTKVLEASNLKYRLTCNKLEPTAFGSYEMYRNVTKKKPDKTMQITPNRTPSLVSNQEVTISTPPNMSLGFRG